MRIKKTLIALTGTLAAGSSLAASVTAISCGAEDEKVAIVLDGPNSIVEDKSFNQAVYEGIRKYLGSAVPGIYKPTDESVDSFVQMYSNVPDKSVIVAPGFAHVQPISRATHGELQNKKVILLDSEINYDTDNESLKPQIAAVVYKPGEAAFVAGYLLAKNINEDTSNAELSKLDKTDSNGKIRISTFGGKKIQPVEEYMSSFQKGVNFYNTSHPASIVEWHSLGDVAAHFTDTFAPGGGRAMAQKLLSAGVDIVFPVAAQQYQDVIQAYDNANHKPGFVIGVDSVIEDFETQTDRILFSITKNLSLATYNLLEVIDGGKTIDGYEGLGHTLVGGINNDLVGISGTSHSRLNMLNDFNQIIQNHSDPIYTAAMNMGDTAFSG